MRGGLKRDREYGDDLDEVQIHRLIPRGCCRMSISAGCRQMALILLTIYPACWLLHRDAAFQLSGSVKVEFPMERESWPPFGSRDARLVLERQMVRFDVPMHVMLRRLGIHASSCLLGHLLLPNWITKDHPYAAYYGLYR